MKVAAGNGRAARDSTGIEASPRHDGRLTVAFTGAFVITCCIQYTLDPHRIEAFADYARRWPPIIDRCGGDLIGYWLPKEGANNFAVAMIEFESLAAYEVYRRKLAGDSDAQRNVADVRQVRAILVESRSFLQRA